MRKLLRLALVAALVTPVFAQKAVEVPVSGNGSGSTPVVGSGQQTGSGKVGNVTNGNMLLGREDNFRVSVERAARLRAIQENMLSGAFDSPTSNGANSSQAKGIISETADKIRAIRDRLLGKKGPTPPVGRGGESANEEAPSGRLWVSVKATSRDQRTRASELGVAIVMAYADRVEGTIHESAIGRLNAAGLTVLKSQSLESFAALNFPPQDSPYHDYTELTAELQALAGQYPDKVSLFSIGKSLQGSDIWAIRINTTEKGQAGSKKPGIVFMGNHHAREHLSVEIPLMLVKHLASSKDPEVARLVGSRDIYIIPMVNPDGAEFDVYNRDEAGKPRSGKNGYQMWRKNRRKNADGSYGVDLNRNYGYKWNTGGSSDSGRDETYHGPAPFSEPETQAIRDFVNARPNLKVLLSFHTFSELILYPWGHTYDPIADGKARQVYETMARTMAGWNGYTPEQSSDLYIASGDTTDWSWGEKKIFSFTFELTPKSMWDGGFYPGAGVIASTFEKNLKPALYLIEYADDPYRVLQSNNGSGR